MKRIKLYLGSFLLMSVLLLNAQNEIIFEKAFTNVCDTVIVNGTTVYVDSSSIDTINVGVCSGDSYTFIDGTVIESCGNPRSHTSILEEQAWNGCDSLVEEYIYVFYNPTQFIEDTICFGSSYTYLDGTVHDSIVENESHTSVLEGQASNGCDSLVVERISFFPSHILDVSICSGSSYTYLDGTVHDNIVENESHTSILEGQAWNGCDSLVVENIEILPNPISYIDVQICRGSSYTYLDGTVHDSIVDHEWHTSILEGQAANGCDSLVREYIDFFYNPTGFIYVEICRGSSYTYLDGTVQDSIVNYESHISVLEGQTVNGCDSLVEEFISFFESYVIDVQICRGGSYTYLDGTVHDSIIDYESHISVLEGQTVNGCDSLVEEHIYFFPFQHIIYVPICFGSSYTYLDGTVHDSIVENESHISVLEGQTVNGCDSLVIEYISFFPPHIVDVEICRGSSYTYLDGTVHDSIVENESHTSILESQTVNGCDSVVEERIYLSQHYSISGYVCWGDSYIFPDGTVHDNITEDEIYTCSLSSTTSNCDSIIIFDLKVYEVIADWTEVSSLSTDTIVAGDTLWLNAGAFDIDSVFMYQSAFNPVFIPDDVGVSYEYPLSIIFDGTIQSVNDIQEIGLNIEHSYVGDLDIQIECPNGQTMAILQYPNDCMSTHFGEPCKSPSTTIGVGYDYSFTPDADSSLLNKVDLYQHNFIDNNGNSIENQPYFPAGAYLPVGSFDSLIGCPIQGGWKLRIVDNRGWDDGYVFNWHISFKNHYETFWSGDSIDNANSLSTFAIPNEGGLQTYTFSIEDANHCSYDTTLSVFVIGDINQGLEYQSKQEGIQIYPNPSQDFIYVKGVQKAICRIYTVNGTLIKEFQDIQKPLDVQELPKGIYLLDIQSNNAKQQFKLIKM